MDIIFYLEIEMHNQEIIEWHNGCCNDNPVTCRDTTTICENLWRLPRESDIWNLSKTKIFKRMYRNLKARERLLGRLRTFIVLVYAQERPEKAHFYMCLKKQQVSFHKCWDKVRKQQVGKKCPRWPRSFTMERYWLSFSFLQRNDTGLSTKLILQSKWTIQIQPHGFCGVLLLFCLEKKNMNSGLYVGK